MHIIPVLDIKDGLVVRARMGNRDAYLPIETPLSRSPHVSDVTAGLRALYPFPAFYFADLDAIERRQSPTNILHQLKPVLARSNVWLDAGYTEQGQVDAVLTRDGILPVLGSESQGDSRMLEYFREDPRIILSLDFRGDEFLGPASILENAENWPSRIIVMTLGRVGATTGPDFGRLEDIKRRAGSRSVVAAGGIRNNDDLEKLQAMGISAALVATSLHNGALSRQAIASFMKSS